MTYKFHTNHKKLLGDTFTPVSTYLKLRDKFPCSILLESTDFHGNENSFSFICCNPVASITINENNITERLPDGTIEQYKIEKQGDGIKALEGFSKKFDTITASHKFISNGLFGYITYDAVQYFEDIQLHSKVNKEKKIPDVVYSIYQYVIAFDHFRDELHIFEHTTETQAGKGVEYIESIIQNKNFPSFRFSIEGNEKSNLTDDAYRHLVTKGREHCKRGDVFQIVLSREFSQTFKGDEFNVYRTLRSINPSPYLFYFDYGNYKIFGSSPEAQLTIQNGVAGIHPIAGTFRRTGNDAADAELAEKLKNDAKENAEHVMLVDLARNDLSRDSTEVKVEKYREVQYFSHVIHLVSKVTGVLPPNTSTMKVVADTFPAGTLSGAPKYKAMELIDKYENDARGFYGGCIGYMGFNGDFNHAIIIRSFLSKNNTLYYRAGAGVVEKSVEENELNEVTNKLAALKTALEKAKEL